MEDQSLIAGAFAPLMILHISEARLVTALTARKLRI